MPALQCLCGKLQAVLFISHFSFIFFKLSISSKGEFFHKKIINHGLLSPVFTQQALRAASHLATVPGWGHRVVFLSHKEHTTPHLTGLLLQQGPGWPRPMLKQLTNQGHQEYTLINLGKKV